MAELTWEVDNDADCITIGQAQYRSQGGARVPLGRGPCTIEVRAVIMADGVSFASPPVRAVVDQGVEARISYTVSATPSVGPFGGRSKKVTFRSDESCAGVQVRMVALPGRVMPARAEGGFVLLDTTLTLSQVCRSSITSRFRGRSSGRTGCAASSWAAGPRSSTRPISSLKEA